MNNYVSEKIKIISFISIILVVFLHAYNLGFAPETAAAISNKTWNWFIQDLISYGITRIAVPLFFLFSGFWFFYKATGKSQEFSDKIKKRFFTLFIPFLFWSLFGIAFYFTLQSLPQFEKFFSKELVKDYTAEMWLVKIFIHPIPYQLWFIRDLMLLVLLSPLLYYALKYLGRIFLAVVLALWFCHIDDFHNSIEALLFFGTGGFIGLYREDLLSKTASTGKATILVLLWISLLVIKSVLGWYGAPVLLVQSVLNVSILAGVPAFWLWYDAYLAQNRRFQLIILHLSTTTFFLFASHEPILTMVKKVLFIVVGSNETASLAVYFLAPCVTLVLVYSVALSLRKFATRFYQIVTGGR